MFWYVVIHCDNGVYEDVIASDEKQAAIDYARKRFEKNNSFFSRAAILFENAYPLSSFPTVKAADMPRWTPSATLES